MRSYGGSSSGLVPDHGVGLLAHLVEVGDAQLPSLEEVFDMRARLLEGEEPRVALARPEQPQRHPEERHGLAAEIEDLAETPIVVGGDGPDAPVQLGDWRLVPGEGESYAAEPPNLVERLEIELEAAEGRDRGGRLMRRDAREHVISGEEQIVHLEANLAGAVPGRVVHAIAVDDLLTVLHHAVDAHRFEVGLGEAIHRLELAPELAGKA